MSSPKPHRRTGRLHSLDAYRGFVMLAMVSGGFGVAKVAESFPDSKPWQWASYQFQHVPWVGCSFWDLIQTSFLFIVGVAAPFSIARRRAEGQSFARRLLHAILRSIVLVGLGVLLYSNGHSRTNYTFVNVLAQIGLGYTVVFLLAEAGVAAAFLGLVAIALASWALFAYYPVLDAEQAKALGLPADSKQFEGFAAHWNKHANAAGAFDRWFLNLFPQKTAYVFNAGGYQTLNFFPSILNMLVGVLAGELLRSSLGAGAKTGILLAAGLACLAAAAAVDHTIWPTDWPPVPSDHAAVVDAGHENRPFASREWTICPAVKRIWTPTFAIFSAGWTLLLLAAFFLVIDGAGFSSWAFPLAVVGMNSIAVYLVSQLTDGWIVQTIKTHAGQEVFSGTYGPIGQRVSVVAALWLFAFYLYKQRAFLRI